MHPKLQALFDARPGLKRLSKTRLRQEITGEGVPGKALDEYFEGRERDQLYSKPQFTPQLRITAPPDHYQLDIIHLTAADGFPPRANRGVSKLLTLIEIVSRKAFAYPLKDGTASEVVAALRKWVAECARWEREPRGLQGDDFFNAAAVVDFCADRDIVLKTDVADQDHLTPTGGNKLGIIDRFARTLRAMLKRHMLDEGTDNWVDALPDLLDGEDEGYNNLTHSSLKGLTPNMWYADDDLAERQHKTNRKHNDSEMAAVDLGPGDRVRLMQAKGKFDKEKPRFGVQVHTIADRVGNRFQIEGVDRLYRPGELFKVGASVTQPLPAKQAVRRDKEAKQAKQAAKARRAAPGVSKDNVLPSRQKREARVPARFAD